MVVPHQANQRIIDAIAEPHRRAGLQQHPRSRQHVVAPAFRSASPNVLPTLQAGDRLGLCAFGGGFTFGAGLVEAN